jgi:hypothetical protein
MTTFVLVHGGWACGWVVPPVRPELTHVARSCDVVTVELAYETKIESN